MFRICKTFCEIFCENLRKITKAICNVLIISIMVYSKEWRERMGYTQAQLAKACGVTLRTVQNWDMGSNVPASSLYKLEALETSGKVNGNCVAAAPNTQTNVNQQGLDAFTAEIAALRRMFEDQLARKDDMIEKLITALSQK